MTPEDAARSVFETWAATPQLLWADLAGANPVWAQDEAFTGLVDQVAYQLMRIDIADVDLETFWWAYYENAASWWAHCENAASWCAHYYAQDIPDHPLCDGQDTPGPYPPPEAEAEAVDGFPSWTCSVADALTGSEAKAAERLSAAALAADVPPDMLHAVLAALGPADWEQILLDAEHAHHN